MEIFQPILEAAWEFVMAGVYLYLTIGLQYYPKDMQNILHKILSFFLPLKFIFTLIYAFVLTYRIMI